MRIWNRALTDEEIKAEMLQGLGAFNETPETAAEVDLKFDLNGDGVVDINDVNILVGMLGKDAPQFDFNNDAVINILDVRAMLLFIEKRNTEETEQNR